MDLHQALNIEGSDTEKGWSTYKGQDVSTGRPQSGIRHCFQQIGTVKLSVVVYKLVIEPMLFCVSRFMAPASHLPHPHLLSRG